MSFLGNQSGKRKKEEIKKALDDFYKIEGKKFNYTLSKRDLLEISRKVKRRSFFLRNFNCENVLRIFVSFVKWLLIIYCFGGVIFWIIDKYIGFLGEKHQLFHLWKWISKPFDFLIEIANSLLGKKGGAIK